MNLSRHLDLQVAEAEVRSAKATHQVAPHHSASAVTCQDPRPPLTEGQASVRSHHALVSGRRYSHDASVKVHRSPSTPVPTPGLLSLIHISEPTRQAEISYAVFCLKKKK